MKEPVLAIDLGGTRVKIGLFQESALVAFGQYPAFSQAKTIENLDLVTQYTQELCTTVNMSITEVQRIGLAFPGLVDSDQSTVISSKGKYEDASKVDFKEWAREHFQAGLRMDNDSRLACLGEKMAGAGKEFSDMVMVTYGTGIGTGVIINNELLIGKHFQGGCLGGHMPVVANGRLCHCGNRGCLEAECSLVALNAMAKNHPEFEQSLLSEFDFEQLFEACRMHDSVANEITDYCLSLWGTGLVSLIHAYDPDAIILGGGIMESADIIVPSLMSFIERYAWTPSHEVHIVEASLGAKAGVYGAYFQAIA